MQARSIGMALAGLAIASMAAVVPASAQSPLDGPLSASDTAAPAARTAHAKPKARKAHHAAAKGAKGPATGPEAAVPRPTAAESPSGTAAPGDALDLGMKWNGSNDGSAQTKYQSGPNTTSGTGAEVGMKLHF